MLTISVFATFQSSCRAQQNVLLAVPRHGLDNATTPDVFKQVVCKVMVASSPCSLFLEDKPTLFLSSLRPLCCVDL